MNTSGVSENKVIIDFIRPDFEIYFRDFYIFTPLKYIEVIYILQLASQHVFCDYSSSARHSPEDISYTNRP